MNFAQAMKSLEFARNTPFRLAYKDFVGNEKVPTVNNESFALITTVSAIRLATEEEIIKNLPTITLTKFEEFTRMKTERTGNFFKRFVLLKKSSIDGILIGIGADDFYYVLLVWDHGGFDSWFPKVNSFNEPVLV